MNTQVLRAARSEAGLTQAVVASLVGVDIETYRRWENGWQNPNPTNHARVRAVLVIQ